MLGWGAYLSIEGELTGGMVIAASIIAGRAFAPMEGAIEGWHQFVQSRAAYGRMRRCCRASPLNFERLNLPRPEGRLDVERLLYVPQGTKRWSSMASSSRCSPAILAVIGNSGAGKTTSGKMLVGSILPTAGNVRLDLMELRNWDRASSARTSAICRRTCSCSRHDQSQYLPHARRRHGCRHLRGRHAGGRSRMIPAAAGLRNLRRLATAAPLSGGQKQRSPLPAPFSAIRAWSCSTSRTRTWIGRRRGVGTRAEACQGAEDHGHHHYPATVPAQKRRQDPPARQRHRRPVRRPPGRAAGMASRGLSIEGGTFGHQIQ